MPFELAALYFMASSERTATTLSGKWSVKKSFVTSKPCRITSRAVTHRASYASASVDGRRRPTGRRRRCSSRPGGYSSAAISGLSLTCRAWKRSNASLSCVASCGRTSS